MNLYLTADQIGTPTGGGAVTFHESEALKGLGPCEVFGRGELASIQVEGLDDPWLWDVRAFRKLSTTLFWEPFRLAHVYAGTFTDTVRGLKENGIKVAYTAAAHDVAASRRAHEELGVPYNYLHMTDPALWARYVQGYLDADVLVCPSQHSAAVMRGFGAKQRIEVIPHGCYAVDRIAPLPPRFTVGALGAIGGPDKGLRYLLEAWEHLNYDDAVLRLAGPHSATPWVVALVNHFCPRSKGSVELCGWVDNLADYYDSLSLLVQPSVTEGFGIEILESMMHGRLSLASTGAGGADVALAVFQSGDVEELASRIDQYKKDRDELTSSGLRASVVAKDFTWDKIRQRYVDLWTDLLHPGVT